MDEIKLGIYRHYKGPLYQVLGIAHDANAGYLVEVADVATKGYDAPVFGERTVVVYMPLQLDGAHLGPRMAVRTLEDFTGVVVIKWDGTSKNRPAAVTTGLFKRYLGNMTYEIERFEYLGQELTAGMFV